MGSCRVLYKGNTGVMTFEGKKPIFQHKDCGVNLSLGLGVILQDTLVDKGRYAFASMRNVKGVIPNKYYTVEFFERVGMPSVIMRGTYGNSVFVKEDYEGKTLIRTFDNQGKELIYEREFLIKENRSIINIRYCKLLNEISNWVNITDEVFKKVLEGLKSKNCELSLDDPYILYALKNIYKNGVYKDANGVIYANGKFETLAIWEKSKKVAMAWLSKRVDNTDKMEDIAGEIELKLQDNKVE